jgi:hypothetical protein
MPRDSVSPHPQINNDSPIDNLTWLIPLWWDLDVDNILRVKGVPSPLCITVYSLKIAWYELKHVSVIEFLIIKSCVWCLFIDILIENYKISLQYCSLIHMPHIDWRLIKHLFILECYLSICVLPGFCVCSYVCVCIYIYIYIYSVCVCVHAVMWICDIRIIGLLYADQHSA